jgi:hypothetical protein
VGKLRRLPVECLVQLDVFWRRKKPLLREADTCQFEHTQGRNTIDSQLPGRRG